MARGRFISNTIAIDREINALSSDTCRLAFTWLLTFADCEGRVTGEPDLLRASLFPRRQDITPHQLETFIHEWVTAGFVVWYRADNGDRFLQFLNFAKHQVGLRKDRERFSAHPAPQPSHLLAGCLSPVPVTPELLRSDTGPTPAESKEEVNNEVKSQYQAESESPATTDPLPESAVRTTDNLLQLYTDEIGTLTPAIRAQLLHALNQYGEDRLTYAVLQASQHNARSWSYIQAILTTNPSQPPKTPTRAPTALEIVKAEMRRAGCDPTGIFTP